MMDWPWLMILAAVLLFIFFMIMGAIVLHLVTNPYPNLHRTNKEKSFFDPQDSQRKNFPNIHEKSSTDLSVIIPSYNEEKRLPVMMDEAILYLEKRQKEKPNFKYELIVVDDGSSDRTTEVGLKYSKQYGTDKVRVLTLEKNRGKGGAVRLGMLSSRGSKLLFADADGATKFSDIEKLEDQLKQVSPTDTMLVICGSRAHLEKESIAKRSIFRTFLMYGFHFLVWFFCVRGIKDTQCGFKLLTRPAAAVIFYNMHVDRWAFDVDMLYLAQKFHMPIKEVAVTWHEVEGSKVTPFWSWLQMGRDIMLIRLRYLTGAWKITHKPKIVLNSRR